MIVRAPIWKAALVVVALSAPAQAQDDPFAPAPAEAPPAEAAPPADAAPTPATDDAATETPAAGAPAAETGGEEGLNLTLQDRIKAVNRKTFLKTGRFELEPFGGLTVNDAFFRRWAIGARAAYYLNDAFAIDFGGAATFDQVLDPVIELRKGLSAVPDENKLFGYADVGVNFTPIYGKVAALSEWIIPFDAFVSAGFGVTVDSSINALSPDIPVGFHPAMEVGIGARVFLLRWLVVRADLRDYIYPQDRSDISKLQNLLMFNIGFGFFFPFDFEYQYEATKVVG